MIQYKCLHLKKIMRLDYVLHSLVAIAAMVDLQIYFYIMDQVVLSMTPRVFANVVYII